MDKLGVAAPTLVAALALFAEASFASCCCCSMEIGDDVVDVAWLANDSDHWKTHLVKYQERW